jgi:hypothetical protein
MAGLALALGIIITYSKAAILALFQKPPLSSAQGLIAGIWITYIGIFGHVFNNALSQFAIYPPDVVHSLIGVGTLLVALIGGMLTFVSSYMLVGKKILVFGWWTVGVTIGLSAFGYFLVPSDWWHTLDPNYQCGCKGIMDVNVPAVVTFKPWDDILSDHPKRQPGKMQETRQWESVW